MPRVPTAGTTTGRIRFVPQSHPGQTLATFGALADVFDAGAKIAFTKTGRNRKLRAPQLGFDTSDPFGSIKTSGSSFFLK